MGKRLYFQQSLYQEMLKKDEKSCGGHLREKTCENGDHAVVSSVGYRVFETRIASRVRTTDVKHRFRKETEEWTQKKITHIVG